MSTATILPTLRQRVESALLPTGLVHSSADEEEDAA